MAKFPSQRKLLYQTGNISDSSFVTIASGGTAGDLNLPKDLSLLNRRGYASTTRKGVPLVYKCKIDFMLHDFAGAVAEDIEADGVGILRISGCQNNWVMRNAAVKWHAAREAMWKQAGVKKSQLGAYAHEIRYAYDSVNDTWIVPIDGDGAAFTGGTWDFTEINNGIDEDGFQLRLVGDGADEDAATTPNVVTIGHSYLQSRRQLDPDTNDGADGTPSNHSLLNATLFDVSDDGSASPKDDIVDNARGQGDNQPYEVFDGATTQHDITEPVELGRVVVGRGMPQASMIVEIPFGLAEFNAKVTNLDADQADTQGLIALEVLDIYEMQG